MLASLRQKMRRRPSQDDDDIGSSVSMLTAKSRASTRMAQDQDGNEDENENKDEDVEPPRRLGRRRSADAHQDPPGGPLPRGGEGQDAQYQEVEPTAPPKHRDDSPMRTFEPEERIVDATQRVVEPLDISQGDEESGVEEDDPFGRDHWTSPKPKETRKILRKNQEQNQETLHYDIYGLI